MATVTRTKRIWAVIIDGEIADVSAFANPMKAAARSAFNSGHDAYVVEAEAVAVIDPATRQAVTA